MQIVKFTLYQAISETIVGQAWAADEISHKFYVLFFCRSMIPFYTTVLLIVFVFSVVSM